MAQENLIELAKQGQPQAVSALINRSLSPKGITAKVSRKEDCLRILLEASEVPNQTKSVEFVSNGIVKLGIANVAKLQIFGRQIGDEVPAWSQTVNLTDPGELSLNRQELSSVSHQEAQPNLSKSTTTEYVPSSRVADAVFGILFLLGSLILFAIPIIGWVIGILGIIGSLGLLGNVFARKGSLKGICPYCGAETTISEDTKGEDCKVCKHRIVVRDRKFYRVD